MKVMKFSTRKVITFLIIIILFFQNPLEMCMPLFNYVDEILAMIGILYFLCDICRKKISVREAIIVLLLTAFVSCGLLGNALYADNSVYNILSDIFVCHKFFAVIYLSYHCLSKYLNKNIVSFGVMISKSIIVLILSLAITDFVFEIWDSQVRYGIKSLKLFWGHSTYLAAALAFLMMILLLSRKKETVWILLDASLIVLTLRSKAIAFSIIFVILYFIVVSKKKKVNFWKITPFLALIALIVGLNNIKFYFIQLENSARSILLRTSIQIAKDYFPFGVGFASFGSNIANDAYGRFYYQYGLDLFKETSKYSGFLNDSFWPSIIAQSGVIGSVFYILTHCVIVNNIFNSEMNNRKFLAGSIGIYLYLILSSVAEPAFNNSIAVPLGIMLGIFLSENRRGEKCS